MSTNSGVRTYLSTRQKLPRSKKTDEWAERTMDDIIAQAEHNSDYYGRSPEERKYINYDLYNGKFERSDLEYVVNPYGSDKEMPAELTHYDIISSKINLLLGEEVKRPMNFKVRAVNEDAISAKLEEKKTALIESIQAEFQQGMADQGVAEPPAEPPVSPLKIEKYYNYTYKDIREVVAQDILNYLTEDQEFKRKFSKGFKDALITAEELYYVGINNGNPVLRVVNPINFHYDKDAEVDFIEDSQWAAETRYMSPSTILDEFGEFLDDKQVDYLDSGAQSSYKNYGMGENSHDQLGSIKVYRPLDSPKPIGESGGGSQEQGIRVVSVEWKTMRKIGFVDITDEEGNTTTEMVDEDYSKYKQPGEKITWRWINEVWEGTKIGDGIYVRMGPKQNQQRSIDNPSECKLSYTGYIYNNRNSDPVSMLDRMKPYQYLYNIVWYRLELELAKAKGKQVIIDTAQIPTSGKYAMDMDQWLYYQDSLGLIFINSHEESAKGKTSNFNQFTEIDRSISQSVQHYLGILQTLKQRVGEVSGVTAQREGEISSSELVGNVQRSVMQSNHITEYLFFSHGQLIKRVLTNLVEAAKLAWRGGKKLQYISDDMSIKFLEVNEDFIDSDYAVFISDSSKEARMKESMEQLANTGLQSGMLSMLDVAEILRADNSVEIYNKLKAAEQKQQEQAQQAQEAQQQAAQAENEAKMQLEQMRLQAKSADNLRDNQTKMAIAQLNTDDWNEEERIMFEREKLIVDADESEKDRTHDLKLKGLDLKNKVEVEKIKGKNKSVTKN
jgi:hypothetical protein